MIVRSLGTARRAARWSIVLALVAGALVSNIGPVYAVQVPRTLSQGRPVGAGPVEVPFGIDFVGLNWDGTEDPGRGVEPAVRFRLDGVWGPWQPFEEDGAEPPEGWSSGLVGGGDASAYQVRGVPGGAENATAVAINTTDGPAVTVGYRPVNAAAAISKCRSRADWGADESRRESNDAFDYHSPQVVTIHHTAGPNDGTTDGDAVVRAIYVWHTDPSQPYDDIAYNYLIDGSGRVYEGRWSGSRSLSCLDEGGDGSDFAHHAKSERIVRGGHTENANTANIGIALLGDFTDTDPNAAAVSAAEDLLTELSLRHGLRPNGTVDYENPDGGDRPDMPTIAGHLDWKATACPARVYDLLPQMRRRVAARVKLSQLAVVQLTQAINADGALVVRVTVHDGDGNAIEGAAVTVRVRRAADETMVDAVLFREGIELTGAKGHVRFVYPEADVRRPWCYRVAVRDVVLEGREWDGVSPPADPRTLCV